MRARFLTIQKSYKYGKMEDGSKPCGVELRIRDIYSQRK